jgi:hypothetical protein
MFIGLLHVDLHLLPARSGLPFLFGDVRKQYRRHCGDSFSPAYTTHLFVRLCFDGHGLGLDAQQLGNFGLHLGFVGREPGLLGYDRHVAVADAEAGLARNLKRALNEYGAIRPGPLGVAVWKVLADVARGDSAEDRVGYGVEHGVAVTVSDKAPLMFDPHAAELQARGGAETVNVIAEAYPLHANKVAETAAANKPRKPRGRPLARTEPSRQRHSNILKNVGMSLRCAAGRGAQWGFYEWTIAAGLAIMTASLRRHFSAALSQEPL